MSDIEIIDFIKHKNAYSHQYFLVVDREPEYLYEKKGNWLIGEDSGFFNFYYHEAPSSNFQAFAGRSFDIMMKDGSTIKACGQWWHGVPNDFSDLVYNFGCNTPENLHSCNVFRSGSVDKDIVDNWLLGNEISNNYNRYNKRHPDFLKQTIISRFKE